MRQTFLANEKASYTLEGKLTALEQMVDELPIVVIVHNLETLTVEYMCKRGLSILDLTLDELRGMGKDYHQKYFNPDDVADYLPKITTLLKENKEAELVSYFQQVRRSEKDDWKWYLSATKIFSRNQQGEPSHIITVATPIDPAQHVTSKVNRLLEEKNFRKKHQDTFSLLTKREKEILRLMALGQNSNEIADILHISEKTAKTHRRNIRTKLQVHSNYDITLFAQSFDLI